MYKVKSSELLVGYTAGAYPCFNDVKELSPPPSPIRTSVWRRALPQPDVAGTHLQLSQLKQ